MTDEPEMSYLLVFDRQNGRCEVALEEEPVIDAAVTAWVDSGRQRDRVLSLRTVNGTTWRVLASEVSNWIDSTPASRALATARENALKAEVPDWE